MSTPTANLGAGHATVQMLLDRLHQRIGAAGLAAAAVIPGLSARVDQHAAEVRDLLGVRGRRPTLAALASYADGLLDGATDRGWQAPQHDLASWVGADGVTVRLMALCALARSAMA
ncbi:DUF6401 family natural product biosynthesis protein [Dactylosporangium sp. NBC_01737]|uniref:DUF6401 family natural product biosynthesis protein n=1 Tax=Dactylosporangium sp. NBC_01737 TaxID=2975959 RepID=UPI002E15D813|nr:DUF6401 family natural product biosynthesis protein [Dactylosporangium sp. NBC_01737]